MRRYALTLVVLLILVAHVVWPNRAQLDWPTIALLAILISIVGSRELSALLPFVKRLRLGQAEIEMQESVQRLHQEVEKAEGSTRPQPFAQTRGQLNIRGGGTAGASEDSILDLASRDKESAVVRVAIEIEKELAVIFEKAGLGTEPPKTIRELVNQLASKKLISASTAAAIIDFRNVRNQVIHPTSAGSVSASVLASAIDSGLRILRLLRASTTD